MKKEIRKIKEEIKLWINIFRFILTERKKGKTKTTLEKFLKRRQR